MLASSDSVWRVMSIFIGLMGILFLAPLNPEEVDGPDVESVYEVPLCLNAPPRANLMMTRQYDMPIIGGDYPEVNVRMHDRWGS